MESFYKIQKVWSAQHKKYMQELIDIYFKSKKSKQEEEEEQNILLHKLSDKIKEKYAEVKSIDADITLKKEQIDVVNKEHKETLAKNDKERLRIINEENNLKNKQENFNKTKRDFENYKKLETVRLTEMEDKAKKQERASKNAIEGNKIHLEEVKVAQSALDKQKLTYSNNERELQEAQKKLEDDKRKHKVDLMDAKTLSEKNQEELNKIDIGQKKNESIKKALEVRDDAQKKKDNEHKDKEIAQNLKDVEQTETQQRIDSLIRTHNLKNKIK